MARHPDFQGVEAPQGPTSPFLDCSCAGRKLRMSSKMRMASSSATDTVLLPADVGIVMVST